MNTLRYHIFAIILGAFLFTLTPSASYASVDAEIEALSSFQEPLFTVLDSMSRRFGYTIEHDIPLRFNTPVTIELCRSNLPQAVRSLLVNAGLTNHLLTIDEKTISIALFTEDVSENNVTEDAPQSRMDNGISEIPSSPPPGDLYASETDMDVPLPPLLDETLKMEEDVPPPPLFEEILQKEDGVSSPPLLLEDPPQQEDMPPLPDDAPKF